MRYLAIGILFWASVSIAQTTAHCNSYTLDGTMVTTDCTVNTPTPPPPPPQIANNVQPLAPTPGISPEIWAMAAMAQSNKPPSERQVRKYCKKHSGERWLKRNFNGIVIAEGTCSAQ